MDLPIADYALLADRHGSALVSRDGSVDWLCLMRFDAPSTFARLLGADGGHWSITPRDVRATRRRYVGRSLVLETTHECAGGTVVVTDALAVPLTDDPHAIAKQVPHVLLRRVACTAGEVEVDVSFAPRPEYGLLTPVLEATDGELCSYGGTDGFLLAGGCDWQVGDGTATAVLALAEGAEVAFALQRRAATEPQPNAWSASLVVSALDDTRRAWEAWDDEHADYEGPYADLVSVSARVLQGLSYAPTGASIAAPTTSLPEAPGHGRTWDFRYAWLRDAGLTMRAQWVATCPDEAAEFFDWALGAAVHGDGGTVQVVYGVAGERALHEIELDHLPGWRGTAPVRVGNGAWNQKQHDVYGELLDAAWLLRDQAGPFRGIRARFIAGLADEAARVWRDPDDGIWEVRGQPDHYVSSKMLCWVGLDRACRLVDAGALEATDEQHANWRAQAREIHAEVLERGYSEELGTFTQAYGSQELDASVLLGINYDMFDRDDPRVRSTIEVVERGLDRNGLLDRYTSDDGLPGREGAFLLCSFLLASAYARIGDPAHAREILERTIECANDLGLMSEEADPETNESWGNFPQAFSHVGLVNAAYAIGEAERGGVPMTDDYGRTSTVQGDD